MEDEEIKDTLRNAKTVAVVGISPKEDRPSITFHQYIYIRKHERDRIFSSDALPENH